MKKLLETLYVTTPDSYLFCRNENICVKIGGEEKASVPAVMLDGIVCFGEMAGVLISLFIVITKQFGRFFHIFKHFLQQIGFEIFTG